MCVLPASILPWPNQFTQPPAASRSAWCFPEGSWGHLDLSSQQAGSQMCCAQFASLRFPAYLLANVLRTAWLTPWSFGFSLLWEESHGGIFSGELNYPDGAINCLLLLSAMDAWLGRSRGRVGNQHSSLRIWADSC